MPQAKTKANWQKALDDLTAGASGPFFFMKSTKTKIKLINQETDPEHFFLPVTSIFKGQPKTKYLVMGVVISTEGQELSDKWKGTIVPIVMPKLVIKSLLTLLAEGYDLFDEKEGFGITVIKTGRGTDTDYNVMPSPTPYPLEIAKLKPSEKTLEDFAELFSAKQEARNGGGATEDAGW